MGILEGYLNDLDKFICLLSALGHDIGKQNIKNNKLIFFRSHRKNKSI